VEFETARTSDELEPGDGSVPVHQEQYLGLERDVPGRPVPSAIDLRNQVAEVLGIREIDARGLYGRYIAPCRRLHARCRALGRRGTGRRLMFDFGLGRWWRWRFRHRSLLGWRLLGWRWRRRSIGRTLHDFRRLASVRFRCRSGYQLHAVHR